MEDRLGAREFQKGAHIVNATAFLFASTNLVIEIGLVIWTLMGWRFVAAEFFGGVLLILVVAVLLKWFAPEAVFREAREHLDKARAEGHEHGDTGSVPWSKLATREGLAAAGSHFAADWRMIGKDIALGLVIAGTLAAVVPQTWWETLFLASGGPARRDGRPNGRPVTRSEGRTTRSAGRTWRLGRFPRRRRSLWHRGSVR